jgi:hypothetical protein
MKKRVEEARLEAEAAKVAALEKMQATEQQAASQAEDFRQKQEVAKAEREK